MAPWVPALFDRRQRTLGTALVARPLLRTNAPRRAIDDAWKQIVRHAANEDSPLLGLHERCRERCERHDRIVADHICPACRNASMAMHVVRRPLREDEYRLCADCRDRALTNGRVSLCDSSVHGSCAECDKRHVPLYYVGRCAEPLTVRVCTTCATNLEKKRWRTIVVSTLT